MLNVSARLCRSVIIATLALFISFACAGGFGKDPTAKPPTTTPASLSTENISIDYQYTSEMITILSYLYGSALEDFTIAKITNDNALPVKVRLETKIEGFTETSIDSASIEAGKTLEIRQNPVLLSDAIDNLNTQRSANYHIRLLLLKEGEEKEILNQTHSIMVFARRDFPWQIQGFEQHEIFYFLAAMVTPQDPAVEELIRVAADYIPDGIIRNGYGGYVNDEANWVWDRMEAIWQAEANNYDLTYVSTLVSFAPGAVQRIRLPAEVLEQHSGNCIELALLYASAAEAMKLESAIINKPGHTYVAIRTDLENANYYFIETTLIGRADFASAIQAGNKNWEEDKAHVDTRETNYGWVTISEARQMGIVPISWK